MRAERGAGGTREVGRDLRAHSGFTLLEVMAAVAILAIWYIVLAGAAVQGLRAEGANRRVLEAALLADSTLADLEAGAIAGTAPEIQDEVLEDPSGSYQIRIAVTPFTLAGLGAGQVDAQGSAETAPDGTPLPPPSLRGLIGKEMPGMSSHLRSVTVQVAWREGAGERFVERKSFVFDRQAAIAAIQELLGTGETPSAEEEGERRAPEADQE